MMHFLFNYTLHFLLCGGSTQVNMFKDQCGLLQDTNMTMETVTTELTMYYHFLRVSFANDTLC